MESNVNAEIAKNIEQCARQLFEVERKVQILKVELATTVNQLRGQTVLPGTGSVLGVPSFTMPVTGTQTVPPVQGLGTQGLTTPTTPFGTVGSGFVPPYPSLAGVTTPFQGISPYQGTSPYQGISPYQSISPYQGITPFGSAFSPLASLYAGLYASPYGGLTTGLPTGLTGGLTGGITPYGVGAQQLPLLTGGYGLQGYGYGVAPFGVSPLQQGISPYAYSGLTTPVVHGFPGFGQGIGTYGQTWTPFTQGLVNPAASQFGYIW